MVPRLQPFNWKEHTMFGLAKILFPIDFSHPSAEAAHYAGMLACRFRSELTLLHVMPAYAYPLEPIEIAVGLPEPAPTRMEEMHEKLIAFIQDQFRGLTVKHLVLEGDPAVRIIETAASEKSDLIMMPTHGYGSFRRFILGSVAAKVLHAADCPVFTGVHLDRPAEVKKSLFQHILCAVDLGPQSRKVLAWAAGIAGELDAHLYVVHVLPELGIGEASYFDPDWRVGLAQSDREQIELLLRDTGVNAEILLDSGDVPQVIRNVAESVRADLVVIGRHPNAGILGRLRQHAYGIVRESPCPVVSV
jgi:nucleotide-binding universal stress UspA family protein